MLSQAQAWAKAASFIYAAARWPPCQALQAAAVAAAAVPAPQAGTDANSALAAFGTAAAARASFLHRLQHGLSRNWLIAAAALEGRWQLQQSEAELTSWQGRSSKSFLRRHLPAASGPH